MPLVHLLDLLVRIWTISHCQKNKTVPCVPIGEVGRVLVVIMVGMEWSREEVGWH